MRIQLCLVALFVLGASISCGDDTLVRRSPAPDLGMSAPNVDIPTVEPMCGDGTIDDGEFCDPPSSCPTTCMDANSCTIESLLGSAEECRARCEYVAIEVCQNGDGCCRTDCNANNDDDCAPLCGNDVVEGDEVCDPCPINCDDQNACTTDSQTGMRRACDVRCTYEPVVDCTAGDGCCPMGCSVTDDSDCSDSCGDGTLDPGETCDPPESCPTSCGDADACTEDVMTGSAANCNVVCNYPPLTVCSGGDGCCPAGCDSVSDDDCPAQCGNGVVEAGETCDPPGSCPTSCDDANACTTNVLSGAANTCTAMCEFPATTSCDNGDGCCPIGCDSTVDDDCSSVCGNGIQEGLETCDPPASCPTACDDGNACTENVLTGDASTCSAACSHPATVACTDGDGCCPSGCNQIDDSDCPVVCGNGVVEAGETCDPPGSCPTNCDDQDACTTDSLSGVANACTAQCANTTVTACQGGDGCCLSSCDSTNDDDCAPACGNNVIEAGETCDPPGSCPTTCDDGNACTADSFTGDAAACTAQCANTDITACQSGDGCCPAGCDNTTDNDCSASCGNSALETGETCDPPSSCPTSCDDANVCTHDTLSGSAATCNVSCSNTAVTACSGGDGCCPSGCNANNDADCAAVCGNAAIEVGETCDPPTSCPTTCDDTNVCTQDALIGDSASCTALCQFTGITSCSGGDGCCPSGCNANNDTDCTAVCGNAVQEAGETCDPPSSCPTSCSDGDACTDDTPSGDPNACTAACSFPPITSCVGGDGCCPSACSANDDSDCTAVCGNNIQEAGETCDPPSSCPTTCDDADSCTTDALTGDAASCTAACTNTAVNACTDNDTCCPSTCSMATDNDCSGPLCGNGVLETGETCDPPSSCPSVCSDGDVCTADALVGDSTLCTAECSFTQITGCLDSDGCCAPGCDSSNDSDCTPPVCGNGIIEAGETCDPRNTCPRNCSDNNACTTDVKTGRRRNCNVECIYTDITSCTDGDGCCPSACNTGNDNDCTSTCGNNVVEAPETCDPPSSCPTSCDDVDVCTVDTLIGDSNTCSADCDFAPLTQCISGDGCCPAGCNNTIDSDCSVTCGNGVVEAGETCDPTSTCPTGCTDGDNCTTDVMTGSANTCDVQCTYADITACTDGDGCCPSGCTVANDTDCGTVCGNNTIDPGETCDPPSSCPTSCDDNNACTTDILVGDASLCTAECTATSIGTCIDGDGCCAGGCDFTTDTDCTLDCTNDATWPAAWTAWEDEVLRLTNIERAAGATCGTTPYPAVPSVQLDVLLRQAARCHTVDMAFNDFVDHQGTDGSFMDTRVDSTGYNWQALGENVAGGQTSPAAVMNAWMTSPGHCANIMSSSFTELGVGYVYNGAGLYRHYWTQVFGNSF
jgi:hypothetical protein